MREISKGVIDIKKLNKQTNQTLKDFMLKVGFASGDISGYGN
jgi:hypothetical protein